MIGVSSIGLPDGQLIAFSSTRNGDLDIYVMNADGSGVRQLTDNPGLDGSPAWSPGGGLIAFTSERDGDSDIYVMNADGSGVTRLTEHPGDDWGPDWSPDGQLIAFTSDPRRRLRYIRHERRRIGFGDKTDGASRG